MKIKRFAVGYPLEELLGRCRRQLGKVLTRDRHTVLRVPRIVTRRPGQLRGERGEEIVDRPANYGVVVHAHVDVDEADRVANTCKAGRYGLILS